MSDACILVDFVGRVTCKRCAPHAARFVGGVCSDLGGRASFFRYGERLG